MKTHVFNTWILAIVLHPLFFIVMFLIADDRSMPSMEDLALLVFGTIIAAIFALPCLFASWYLISKIINHSSSLLNRFLIWLMTGCGMIVVYAGVTVALFGKNDPEMAIAFAPALSAIFVSICIRFRAFILLAARHDKTEELELN